MRAERELSHLDFDWDQPAVLPFWLPRSPAASAISQFYHGEIATAQMCRRIRSRMDGPATGAFLDAQADDEQRHARIFLAYLEKIGGPDPRPPAIAKQFEKAIAWQGAPAAVILAFHAILEGESLRLQQAIERWLPCPLFKEISAAVARDEARHIAFGKIYLRETLPHLPREERLEIYCWTRDLWFGAIRNAVERFAPPGFFRPAGGFRCWAAAEWRERLDDLENLHLFAPEERRDFVAA